MKQQNKAYSGRFLQIVFAETVDCWENNLKRKSCNVIIYEGWNFNSGNYLFTTDTK